MCCHNQRLLLEASSLQPFPYCPSAMPSSVPPYPAHSKEQLGYGSSTQGQPPNPSAITHPTGIVPCLSGSALPWAAATSPQCCTPTPNRPPHGCQAHCGAPPRAQCIACFPPPPSHTHTGLIRRSRQRWGLGQPWRWQWQRRLRRPLQQQGPQRQMLASLRLVAQRGMPREVTAAPAAWMRGAGAMTVGRSARSPGSYRGGPCMTDGGLASLCHGADQ